MKKTITIDSFIVKSFVVSILFSTLCVFALNHLGRFEYLPDTSGIPNRDEDGRVYMSLNVPPTANIASITYTSYFGSEINIINPGYKLSDVAYKDYGEFSRYENRYRYFVNGTVKDYPIIFIIGSILCLLSLFFKKFKFQLS